MGSLGFKGKGRALFGILVFRRNQAYSGVVPDGSKDFYAEFIANRGAVRRLPGEVGVGEILGVEKRKASALTSFEILLMNFYDVKDVCSHGSVFLHTLLQT